MLLDREDFPIDDRKPLKYLKKTFNGLLLGNVPFVPYTVLPDFILELE